MIKKIVTSRIFVIQILCFLFSCEDKTIDYGLDTYYVEIVTAQKENEFLSDNGNMIFAIHDDNKKAYSFGDRVLLNYTLLEETDLEKGRYVRINGSSKIPIGKLTLSSEATINSSAKEPVLLESVWIGNHYLNMNFYLNYRSVTHKIGLLVSYLSTLPTITIS